MAETFTSYVVDNDKKFRNALERVSVDIKDLRIPFGLIAKDFYRSERAIWNLKSPGLYPDLAPSTKADRIRRGQPIYPILRRSGFLEASMTNPNDPDAICRITPDSLTIGTTVPWAIYHQSDKPRTRLPQRKFLFIGPEAPRFASSDQQGRLQRWLGILEGFYAEKLKVLGKVSKNG